MKQYHFPDSSLLEKTSDRAIVWRKFVSFNFFLNCQQMSHHLQVLIFMNCLSFRLYHSWCWLYYIYFSQHWHCCDVCGIHLWVYYWDDDTEFNVLKLLSYLCLISINTTQSFKVKLLRYCISTDTSTWKRFPVPSLWLDGLSESFSN